MIKSNRSMNEAVSPERQAEIRAAYDKQKSSIKKVSDDLYGLTKDGATDKIIRDLENFNYDPGTDFKKMEADVKSAIALIRKWVR